eukprot:CAMPEP_0113823394 /NCGR_PEP_ID=MMETSP0328-20130328/2720_1 /TAXON_ID=39455 /ORGANISM="Alexandrium minutum" /LENGTH=50 /DNA_ID=CAMNT_0000791333 /DNA_START=395 /DNA_END=547 /DNA_ORIENTATION=- /assembly_acc=CAM_ASM_000350
MKFFRAKYAQTDSSTKATRATTTMGAFSPDSTMGSTPALAPEGGGREEGN